MGTENGHIVPFLESASLRKRKRKAMKRIKQKYKMSIKGNKKKSCHLIPKVVIDLPFEERKVEGSRKYRRREGVPKVGSRREKKPSLNRLILALESSTQEFWAYDACRVERGRAIGSGIQVASSSDQ